MIEKRDRNKKLNSKTNITIIYDNSTSRKDLIEDFGFSCLIEAYGRKVLFDTGGNGEILLKNIEKLNIDPVSIDDVFISHTHFDHIGGLSSFLNKNRDVVIHVPLSLRGIRNVKKVIHQNKPSKIYDHFYTTGELDHLEQSMAVATEKGLVVIVGCSHPPMTDIFKSFLPFFDIYGIVGGLHSFNQFELFSDLALICPCHCSRYKKNLKSLYPEVFIEGGAGKILEI